jgi:hypothetical protein
MMNPNPRRSGASLLLAPALVAALLVALVTGLSGAAGAAQARPVAQPLARADVPATYTTTIVVTDLAPDGAVLSTHTIKGDPQPLGTRQTITGSARPLLDSGQGGLPSPSGCRTLTVTNKTTTTLGFTAFKFITETGWCWNLAQLKTTLTGVEVRVADVDAQYRYRGVANSFNQNIQNGKRVYRQGFFENCVVKYGCIGAYYPSNDSRVYASGMWTWTTNG